MAHYAKVENGIVTKVIVAEADFFDTFVDSSPGNWLQTSYNTKENIHYGADGQPDNGVAFRGNYAGIGYTYDKANDVFYAPKPYASWSLNTSTWSWEAPVAYPNDGKMYLWSETTQQWIEST
jgi:hypothetical protein